MTQEKHDIIEVGPKKEGMLVRASRRIEATGTKTLVVCGVIGALLIGGGLLVAEVLDERFDRSDRPLVHQQRGVVDRYDEDDRDDVDTSVNQQATPASSSLALVETSELDGTYTAQSADETYTLTVKGNQASLESKDIDGDIERDTLVFDLEQKVAYIDEDKYTYEQEGQNLILVEADQNLFENDRLTFTKQ